MQSLYFHIPFCKRKCFYCDFYSLTSLDQIDEFVDSLCLEIDYRLPEIIDSNEIRTIFFGGGTPSLLEADHYIEIISRIAKHRKISPDAEITIESNPGTLSLNRLNEYKRAGINRLSIGVQSFIDEELQFLERIHSADEAVESFQTAREAGFENISIDLMFSLPSQTKESVLFSIEKALKLNPENLSYYSLIYEPETPLYDNWKAKKVRKLDEQMDAELYELIIDKLTESSYIQYEISNFAKAGYESRHNLAYWHCDEYLGFGPSAHSYIGNKRMWNIKNLKKYIDLISEGKPAEDGHELLSDMDELNEFVYLALRADGISIKDFNHKFQISTSLENICQDFISEGMMMFSKGKLFLTKKGYLLCDEIALNLIDRIEKMYKSLNRI